MTTQGTGNPAQGRNAGQPTSCRAAPMDAFCPGQRVSAPLSVSAWAVHHGGSFFYRARSYSWSFACRAYSPRIPPTAWLGGATFAVPENARLPGEHRNNPQNQGNTGSTRDFIAILPPARPGRPRASAAVTDSPTWYSLTSTCWMSRYAPRLHRVSQAITGRESMRGRGGQVAISLSFPGRACAVSKAPSCAKAVPSASGAS